MDFRLSKHGRTVEDMAEAIVLEVTQAPVDRLTEGRTPDLSLDEKKRHNNSTDLT
jgi:hypothetical protein